MQIQLKQGEIEAAIKAYVSNMGINRPITAIEFTQSRKGGSSIAVDLTLDDPVSVQTTLGTINVAEKVTIAAESPVVEEESLSPVSDEAEAVEEEEVVPTTEQEEVVENPFNKKSVFAS